MKKYYFIIIFIILGFFLPISDYVELNHLMIVDEIGVKCSNKTYHLYFREIIPIRNDNGIHYNYKIYDGFGTDLFKAYKDLAGQTGKNIYIKKVQKLITNCYESSTTRDFFSIHPKDIYHTKKNIKKELEKTFSNP